MPGVAAASGPQTMCWTPLLSVHVVGSCMLPCHSVICWIVYIKLFSEIICFAFACNVSSFIDVMFALELFCCATANFQMYPRHCFHVKKKLISSIQQQLSVLFICAAKVSWHCVYIECVVILSCVIHPVAYLALYCTFVDFVVFPAPSLCGVCGVC